MLIDAIDGLTILGKPLVNLLTILSVQALLSLCSLSFNTVLVSQI